MHYTGRLIDGTVFESTVERGQPTTVGVSRVIKGWIEGLQLMSTGAKYRFWIPEELAYGKHPRSGSAIKPGHMLIFDIQLLGIE